MLIKRKLYSYLEERDFGEVKRANKAAKRAQLIKEGTRRRILPTEDGTLKFVEIGDSVDVKLKRARRRAKEVDIEDPLSNLTAGRSKADRLNNLSHESQVKLFDKRREALGRTGDGVSARHKNYRVRRGYEKFDNNFDVLANKGSKTERLARLSEKNQIRYHRNNAYRGQDMIKWGESTGNITNAQINITPKSEIPPVSSVTPTAPKTPTSIPKHSTPLPDLQKPEIHKGPKVQKPTVSITPNKVKKSSVFNGSFNPMKWSKNAKIVGGITAGTAVLGTGAYLAKKHYDKKKFV